MRQDCKTNFLLAYFSLLLLLLFLHLFQTHVTGITVIVNFVTDRWNEVHGTMAARTSLKRL